MSHSGSRLAAGPSWLLRLSARDARARDPAHPVRGALPDPELAERDAGPLRSRRSRRARPSGVLDGDVVIKDQIDVAGCPNGVGLEAQASSQPATDDRRPDHRGGWSRDRQGQDHRARHRRHRVGDELTRCPRTRAHQATRRADPARAPPWRWQPGSHATGSAATASAAFASRRHSAAGRLKPSRDGCRAMGIRSPVQRWTPSARSRARWMMRGASRKVDGG